MSRAYRVQWSTASTTITATDHCRLELDLLGILPQGQMLDLLRGALVSRGWERQADGALTTTEGEVSVRLAADGSGVELRRTQAHTASGRGTSEASARSAAEQAADSARGDLKTRVARALMAAEPTVRAELHQALQEVYVEALKQKAASLGQVEGMVENQLPDGEIEVVIKVRA